MRRAMRGAAAACAAALLSACAALPPRLQDQVPAFELTGRVAVRYGAEAASGRAEWRHSPAADDLVISTPLGQGIAELTRRGDVFALVTSDGKRHTASDAESLTESVLGWRLPLAGLPEWVRAQPLAGVPAEVQRADGRVARIAQSGWTIEYLEYGENGLPRRLRLQREALDIRLVIEEWR
jgi:outer membrane lipoprotein LolB